MLIVEDHPLVGEATANLVACELGDFSPVLSSNAELTIQLLDQEPEAWFRIFLDLDVPGAYGLSLAKEIRVRGLAGRTCVISAFDSPEYFDKIRQWGFLGYVAKATPFLEFRAAVRSILDGVSSFREEVPAHKQTAIRLTRRQTQLLELIRSGLTSRRISAELHIAEGTVNNLVTAILQAFNAGSRAHAVARAIELGLIDAGPDHRQGERLHHRGTG
ncbi:MAG: response regulator transcription factor [Caldimonas sp.]